MGSSNRQHETRIVALHDEERITATNPGYRYDPTGKAPWLQRLCFAVLTRLIQPRPVLVTTVHFSRVNIERVLDRVKDQFEVAARRNKDRPPTRLIIGARDWHELTGDPELPFYLEGMGTYRASNLAQGYRDRVIGMHVEIIPWVRGVVVAP